MAAGSASDSAAPDSVAPDIVTLAREDEARLRVLAAGGEAGAAAPALRRDLAEFLALLEANRRRDVLDLLPQAALRWRRHGRPLDAALGLRWLAALAAHPQPRTAVAALRQRMLAAGAISDVEAAWFGGLPPGIPAAHPLPPLPGAARFGIVMSVRNHAALLPRALAAIAAQSRPPDRLVLIDDGSEDETPELMAAFAAAHPFARMLRNPGNLGIFAATARGIDACDADFLCFAAADDMLLPGFVAAAAAAVARHPDTGMTLAESALLAPRLGAQPVHLGHLVSGGFLGGLPERLSGANYAAFAADRLVWLSGNTAFYRRDALRAAGGFPADCDYNADWLTGQTILLRHGAVPIPEVLGVLTEDPGSFSARGQADPERTLRLRRALFARIKSPAHAELCRAMLDSPLTAMHLDNRQPILPAFFARHPEHWDLALLAMARLRSLAAARQAAPGP